MVINFDQAEEINKKNKPGQYYTYNTNTNTNTNYYSVVNVDNRRGNSGGLNSLS